MPKNPNATSSPPNHAFARVTGDELLKAAHWYAGQTRIDGKDYRVTGGQIRIDGKDYRVTVVDGIGVLVTRAGPVSRCEAFVNLFTHRFADGSFSSRASRLTKMATDAELAHQFVSGLSGHDLLGCTPVSTKSRHLIETWARTKGMNLSDDQLSNLSMKIDSKAAAFRSNLLKVFSNGHQGWQDLTASDKRVYTTTLLDLLKESRNIEEFKEKVDWIRVVRRAKNDDRTIAILPAFAELLERVGANPQ